MNTSIRKILCLVLALACVFALAACGQKTTSTEPEGSAAAPSEAGAVYTVGIVKFVDHPSLNQIVDNIQKQLDALSAELGVTFDYSVYDGQADATTLNQIGAELVDQGVDIIVPVATPAAQVMKSVTEGTDIPVVFAAVSDPVSAGLVDSMDAPGDAITGTSDSLNTQAILDLMFAADPELDYVGLLYSKSDAIAYLEAKNVRYIEKTGTSTDEIMSAADALVAEGVGAVFTPTDNTVQSAELAIYEKFLDANIPHYGGADSFALNGAFAGYGVDYAVLGAATADMVADILVNGADPASMAVQTFDNGIATINTDTCAAIGFDLDTIREAFKDLCTQLVETTTAEEFE